MEEGRCNVPHQPGPGRLRSPGKEQWQGTESTLPLATSPSPSPASLAADPSSLGYDDCCKSKATARWRHIAVDASQTSESRNTQALFKLFASTSSLVPDGGGCQGVESRLIVQAGSGPMSCCPGPYSSRLPSLSPSRKAAGLREMQETSGFRSWFSSTRMPRLGH